MFKIVKIFHEFNWLNNRTQEIISSNMAYRKRHPEFEQFDMPEIFWFKIYPDRQAVHWAIIRKINDSNVEICFIDVNGRIFDKLFFKHEKIAKRLLRKNKFYSNRNKKPPYMPVQPLFVNLSTGKKTAPYSKGNLWIPQDRFALLKAKKRRRVKKEKSFEQLHPYLTLLQASAELLLSILKVVVITLSIGAIVGFILTFY